MRAPEKAVLLTLAAALAVTATSCRNNRSNPSEDDTDDSGSESAVEAGPPPADWPRVLVIGPGTGPALYLGSGSNAAAVGYLSPGARIRLESGPVNGRIEVLVAGPLATKGWVPLNRIAAYAQQRGRVEGTRAYVGPGDLVTIVGADGDQKRIAAAPWLGGTTFLPAQEGTFARDALGDRPPESEVEGVSEGTCYQLPVGREVPVYDRPGGNVVATLPVMNPPLSVVVLRDGDNGWFGVRAGYGPYVTGYAQGLTACSGSLPIPDPMTPPSGERPFWMNQERRGPLHRVASGTRVRFNGETIARLRAEGWARELDRQDGDLVDVFVAVGEEVALRGLVPADSLTLVEDSVTGAGRDTNTPANEEPLPDELQ